MRGPIRRLRALLRALWADFDGLWDLDDVYSTEESHFCRNCEGIDPKTCLFYAFDLGK